MNLANGRRAKGLRAKRRLLPVIALLAAALVWPAAAQVTSQQASAQQDTAPVSPLQRARALAFDKQRVEALAVLEDYLRQEPSDSDARTFYGIVLSWEGRYDQARQQLETVLDAHPEHGDALPALINVELWSNHPDRAEKLARGTLANRPGDTELLMARARALKNLDRTGDAIGVLAQLLKLDPNNQAARTLRENLRDGSRGWEASLSQSYDWFNDGRSGWFESQATLKYRAPVAGAVLVRYSRAYRYALSSGLVEIDAYPSLGKGRYAYLNAGWSPDKKLYPGNRFGAELYQSLPLKLELSGGLRSLGFASRVNVYTGSLSRYQGNWLFTARTYVTPDSAGDSHSLQFQVRRYLGDDASYFGLRYGTGAAPIERGSVNEIEVLRSQVAGAELNWKMGRRWMLNFLGSHSREDRQYQSRLGHNSVSLTGYFRF